MEDDRVETPANHEEVQTSELDGQTEWGTEAADTSAWDAVNGLSTSSTIGNTLQELSTATAAPSIILEQKPTRQDDALVPSAQPSHSTQTLMSVDHRIEVRNDLHTKPAENGLDTINVPADDIVATTQDHKHHDPGDPAIQEDALPAEPVLEESHIDPGAGAKEGAGFFDEEAADDWLHPDSMAQDADTAWLRAPASEPGLQTDEVFLTGEPQESAKLPLDPVASSQNDSRTQYEEEPLSFERETTADSATEPAQSGQDNFQPDWLAAKPAAQVEPDLSWMQSDNVGALDTTAPEPFGASQTQDSEPSRDTNDLELKVEKSENNSSGDVSWMQPGPAQDEAIGPSEEPKQQLEDQWSALLGDSSELVPDLNAEPDTSWMEPNGTDASQSNTQQAPPADPADAPKDIEDSWSKAFSSADDLNDSWNSLAADLEDDGLTEELAPRQEAQRYQPATTVAAQPQSSVTLSSRYSSYGVAAPVQPQPPKQQAPAKPMEFFAELPVSQNVRSRKAPRPVAPAQTSPTPPPQAVQPPPSGPPPATRGSPYQNLAGPGRMDLFPPQPSVPPTVPIMGASASMPAPAAPPAAPSSTSRYSPSPAQASSASRQLPQSAAPAAAGAGFDAAPPPSAAGGRAPQTLSVAAVPRSKSPYAPPPVAASGRQSPYAKPPPGRSSSYQPQPQPPQPPLQQQQQQQPLQPSSSTYESRYSATPPNQQQNQTAASAYAATPVNAPPPNSYANRDATVSPEPLPPPPANRFAPRTSSPLARNGRPPVDRAFTMPVQKQETPQSDHARHHSQGDEIATPQTQTPQRSIPSASTSRYSPAVNTSTPTGLGSSYSRQPLTTVPEPGYHPPAVEPMAPPTERPQTSSPGKYAPTLPSGRAAVERPPSTHVSAPPASAFNAASRMSLHSQGSGVDDLDFVYPTDETAQDPLQRWKGAPIFRWGPNGSALSCIPKHMQFYGGGQGAPKIKSTPGQPKTQRVKDIVPDDAGVLTFPGPLKSKNKKKEVVAWLTGMIDRFEQEEGAMGLGSSGYDRFRARERVLLWKTVRIFIEHDGILAGNASVDSAVRQVLITDPVESPRNGEAISLAPSPPQTQLERQSIVSQIKQFLLKGEREKAVWLAVDNRLWSHAMLISSTLSPGLWKQVVQEFVRKDVRSEQHPNHSLAALYEVFAGDWEESIDQLVPVSARSGFQMISTADRAGQPRDAMEGLSKWQETLGLILSNRSTDDEKALLALGKLLAAYGRVEAAHICFLFARSVVHFGGADDAQTNVTLLGFDHVSSDTVVGLDSILLTQVYEFGLSFTAASSAYYIPHLQAYKLRHAYALAETGLQTEALQHCDSIASALKSTTRLSPYYHSALVVQLDDLQKRLSQTPKGGNTSWITRPSIGKVGSSMGNWLNNFVAGDDTDAASTGSGNQSEAEYGPFVRNLGGTPGISRSTSVTDFTAGDFAKQPIPAALNSRYAPASLTPRHSLEQDNNGHAFGSYSSSPEHRQFAYSPHATSDAYPQSRGSPQAMSTSLPRQPSQLSQFQSLQPTPPLEENNQSGYPQGGYQPYVPSVDDAAATPYQSYAPDQTSQGSNGYPISNGYAPGASGGTAFGGYEPPSAQYGTADRAYEASSPSNEHNDHGYQPSTGYEPPSGGYDPHAGGYEPPSYQPDMTSPETQEDQPRKKFGEDDEDDIAAKAAELKKQERARADREADEAFRRAAEEDAARDKDGKKDKRTSSGWFGGISLWKQKDPNAPQVHKAKLGEASSFYYDEQTKRWVNPKADPATATQSTSAPPPPRASGPPVGSAPPSRSVSGAGPPPGRGPPPTSAPMPFGNAFPNGPSRTDSPASIPEHSSSDAGVGPQLRSTVSMANLAPPSAGSMSRPPTSMSSMSNASSIDDLLGPAQARKAGAAKKPKKRGGYVDVLAK